MTESLLSETLRINEIGAGVTRRIQPDEALRRQIARSLDLISLDAFNAELHVAPAREGWLLSGRLQAEAVQACGITLDPLPVSIDERFSVDLVESSPTANDEGEVEVSIDDDAPDVIENGKIDLGQYALEQLVLSLDPFPRKPGAEFVQPPEPVEISPFAVLKQFKRPDGGETS